jgi:hypothetical protein
MAFIQYYSSSRTAGYSGFVCYGYEGSGGAVSCWMIPGTFFDDWDNQ